MTPRLILITTAAILLAGCDRRSAEVEAAKAAEIAAQRQIEQAANDKIRLLEDRLNAADQQKAADREAELARVREELAQIKKDKDLAADRIRELQIEANKPAPAPTVIAEAPAPARVRDEDAPRNAAVHADLERVVEEEEDREPVYVGRVVPETQRVSNVESFYEPLDQYGDWIQTDDYGYVFRPEVATRRDWRPYTDGHWVHTGHGWTWQSNEDFGWATYHYGRWTRVASAGWVWVPGREWGPGWVSWRRGREECGWAPLPPESRGRHSFTATVDRDYDIGPSAYVFIALSNFGVRSYAPIIERPERNVNIINKTVNVTNITYNNTTNNTVVYNGGPSYDVIRARSKQPVENVQVNFAPQPPAGDRRKIVNLRQGANFQVAAPPVAVAANTTPPRVKERLGKAKLDKGWDGVDPAQAQRVKQGIVATSTERPKNPRPAVGLVNPNVPKPANPAVALPPTPLTPPVRPVVAAPDPAKPPVAPPNPPQTAQKPETPARPAGVDRPRPLLPDTVRPKPVTELPPKLDKPDEPQKPVVAEPPKVREPETARPKPAPELPPKLDKPDEPKKPVVAEPPKMREPEPVRPKPAPELPPKLDKPDEPKKPVVAEPPKVREPETARPKPVTELPPKLDKPDEPQKPVVAEPPKMREPETARPKPAPELPPKLDRSDEPKRIGDNEPRRVREVAKPATPEPVRAVPRRPETPPAPVVRERPKPPVPTDVPSRPRIDAPTKVKPPVEAPTRVRPVPAPEPAAVRQPPVERRQVAPPVERPAPVSRPVVQTPQPPVRRVVQPERPPQAQRAPEPRVNRTAPPPPVQRAPAVQRPPAPVVQRAPQPPALPQGAPPQKASEESDKRKKKKDGEQ